MTAKERFLKYVTINTQSDENSSASPTTECQKDLGRLLMEELKELGLQDIHMDDCGNVISTLPATPGVKAPAIALIAHVDTSGDASGLNVSPRIVTYTGGEIQLNSEVSLTPKQCPGLAKNIGKDIICTDGTTLLGSDDKAGVAEIMAAVERMITENIPHGELRVIFTTDEEVGRGTDGLNVKELNCAYGYTVDGGELGELEYENFNAAAAQAHFKGVGVHPGSAKDIMVNAAKLALEFAAALPAEQCPEKTEGYEGFFHLHGMEGSMTEATLVYIIRDHDMAKFLQKKELFAKVGADINAKYGEGSCTVEVVDSYLNMKEMIEPHMHIIEKAKAAFLANGVEPLVRPIRGGTDGARLSWDGLPCPNLSTGGFNFHGVQEWIPVDSLETMTGVIVSLVNSYVE